MSFHSNSVAHNNIEPPSVQESEHLLTRYKDAISQVEKVILGKNAQVELMFVALLAKGHVLLDDTPGMGKTTMARSMSAVLGLNLHRIQFTSDLMPSDVVGVNIYHTPVGQAPQSYFQPGPIFSHLLLADEINRASPRTQSALLEAMAEQQVTVDGVSHPLPHPFWVIATQNPIDFSGTFPLPDSQMDRFMFRMILGYPNEQSEMELLLGKSAANQQHLNKILSETDVLQAQYIVGQQNVNERLVKYVLRLVQATRQHSEIVTGLSPRAGLSILHAARAVSWLQNRDYVTPDDVQRVFVDSAAHRIVLGHHAHNHDLRRSLTEKILHSTPTP